MKSTERKFTINMQRKLAVLFFIILAAFAYLIVRIYMINSQSGEKYKKQVLEQQEYSSVTLPYKRGDILDTKGTPLAVSEKVYNLVIDSKIIVSKEEYFEPTMEALSQCFELDMNEVRSYVKEHVSSSYYVPLKRLTYDEISDFLAMQGDSENYPNIKGVWFEEEYKRSYPNGSLACDVIGFTSADNVGTFGLEEYYNDVLNGTTGREYGYLSDDSLLERTTKPAVDGYNIVTTLDANIQTIVERKIADFNAEHKNEARDGEGSNNTGVIIMEVDTGNVLAMASYPVFDLNNPKDLSSLYTEEEIAEMEENDTYYSTLNQLWRNFCISDTYEPGSTMKPFTAAMGLECGALTGNEVYTCNGSLTVGGKPIKCHNRYGDGPITVAGAIEQSCNVALMHMGEAIGVHNFTKYQQAFNFGLKTNIDLAGEARTASLLYTEETMGPAELATNTFGQGFNVNMIQMITGFCSLINGGFYYEPHMVRKIVSENGTTVKTIQPRLLKQTISESTSQKIIEYCNGVVTNGTGKTARPAGYAIGGKTGTAETLPRGNREYVVSFLGYAPANDPQIAIYVVIDRPNVAQQDVARYATVLCREILTEVLPYLNIFMTEELSETEQQELEERQMNLITSISSGDEEPEEAVEGENGNNEEPGEPAKENDTETNNEDTIEGEEWEPRTTPAEGDDLIAPPGTPEEMQ